MGKIPFKKLKMTIHVIFKQLSKIKPMTSSYIFLKVTKLLYKTFSFKMLCFRDINL